jgi:carbon storage regulator
MAGRPKKQRPIGMLILTRRPGESLHVGDNIKITILAVQGKQIKIGLDVPEDIPVYREEVYLRVLEQNRMALQSSDQDLIAVTKLWEKSKKD